MKYILLTFTLAFSFLESATQPMQYRNFGPTRGGRVTAVSGVVNEPNVYYMGATGGGLWKTNDYGQHWENISDGYFETPSIGAIAVYQSSPEIIYVGTGSDGIRSNVIVGKGVYKSTDAGTTWSSVGLKDVGQIGSVLIHPSNPDLVYVAAIGQPFKKSAMRGVYRTANGGQSWNCVFHLSDSVGAVDLEFAPDNPEIIYASMWRAERKPYTIISGGAEDGIYKSTDGGDTWKKKTVGLPTGLVGKTDLAVSEDNPARVWALVQAGKQEGLYKSDDYGESWKQVPMPSATHKSIMYRPFYFTNLHVNPKNADNIWSGTKIFWTSYDGGKTWKEIPSTHADHHDLWINPLDTTMMVEGNDGGASVSRDGGATWSTVFNQPTAELYSCYVDDQYPYYVYSGQQDNSTIRIPVRKPFLDVLNSNDNHGMNDMMYWERVGGCETGPAIPKPGDPSTIYANCKGQFSVYYPEAGVEQLYYIGAESLYSNHPDDITYRFQRVVPMEVSPFDANKVFYGSQYVHVTLDGGKTWSKISPDLTENDSRYRMRSGGPIDEDISGEEYYGVLYAIRESPLQEGVIWTGSNDGLFYVTTNGGKNWKNITPDMPGGGRVSNIEVSPHDPAKAYYAVYRDYLGDEKPYLYKTEDFGKSWSLLTDGTNGIPEDFPTRVVREDPVREGLLFAGTEFGLFISFDDGRNWQPFQRNLPIVPVTDMAIKRGDLVVSTLGRSFWVMEDMTPLQEYQSNSTELLKIYTPKTTYGEVVKVHFRLPDNRSGQVTFEFWRGDELIHQKVEPLHQLPADDLGNRYTEWDLKYYLKTKGKDLQGPKVAPGTYKVKITYGEKSESASFDYKINPEHQKIGISQQDLEAQESLGLDVAKLLVQVQNQRLSLKDQLKVTKSKSKQSKLNEQLALLEKGPKRYDEPKLYDHVDYLYKMIIDAPQRPGRDAYQRYEVLKDQWKNSIID